ncbi:pyruvate formate lyase-activating protein [Candidatus Heimdallarchaeota archaeon B3_Heim]|nr:MAG: pyruvate formate lyase-activating protein [Candidatus Heimdallarchaeota archaeon B3_Heim]
MFRILRMPSESIWQDPVLSERLTRYRAICKGKKIARFLIAKKTPVIGLDDSENNFEKIWLKHKEVRHDFNSLVKDCDKGNVILNDIESPEISFLDLKAKIADKIIENCHFCERRCYVNRKAGETGICKLGVKSVVSSAFLHVGEEPPLVPSGTIFFASCVFKCVFCQNHDISQDWNKDNINIKGNEVDSSRLVAIQQKLISEGAININWVGGDPIPNVHNIIQSLQTLDNNIVQLWNSNMYLTQESMNLLVDIMDFWLPDLKFRDNAFAKRMSGVNNYWETVIRNIKFAYTEGSGEIIIRHLCMPNRIEKDTYPILDWVKDEVPLAFVNIMDQYRPEYRVHRNEYKDINRRVTTTEMQLARHHADKNGIAWRQV